MLGVALATGAAVCGAQTQAPAQRQGSCTMTDEKGKVITLPECANASSTPRPETPQSKSAAQKFPFPGDTPDTPPANGSAPAAPGSAVQGTSGSQTGAPGDGPASKRFPFPGETPDTPQPAAAGGSSSGGASGSGKSPLQDAGSSGESTSSSSSSSNDDNAMKDLGPDQSNDNPYKADDDAARARAAARRSKREAPAAKPQTADERVAEDLQVAGFYRDGGNWRGVYLRAKDAVATEPDDPESHFMLAEAARKLGKLDEAQTEYKAALAHDPIPKTKKAAEKALREMGGGAS